MDISLYIKERVLQANILAFISFIIRSNNF